MDGLILIRFLVLGKLGLQIPLRPQQQLREVFSFRHAVKIGTAGLAPAFGDIILHFFKNAVERFAGVLGADGHDAALEIFDGLRDEYRA